MQHRRRKERFDASILRIAYKLLVNDKGKLAALLLGIIFSVFLMVQMTSMFAGLMKKVSATVTNTGAKVWVMDRAVTSVANAIPMPDYVLDVARSVDGVKYGVPLYSGAGPAHLKDGTYQAVTVLGLDDNSLFGRPALLQGRIEDIYAENGFIVVKGWNWSSSPSWGQLAFPCSTRIPHSEREQRERGDQLLRQVAARLESKPAMRIE
jgi:ABC-type lipoprotein release transport system permease subunit